MIPTTVFLGRYDQPTIDKASSFIALANELVQMPGGDDMARWERVLDWVCENAGGVDRAKVISEAVDHEALLKRIYRAEVGSCNCLTKTDDVQHHNSECPYRLWQEILDRIDTQDAELTELRAQMLSDQGRHMESSAIMEKASTPHGQDDRMSQPAEARRTCATCQFTTDICGYSSQFDLCGWVSRARDANRPGDGELTMGDG